MIISILRFIVDHFSEALITIAVGMFSKALIKQWGNDRANKIKKTILSAMLWAEEEFGLGTGSEKWSQAWNKLIQLLEKQGIVLKEKEISMVQDLMKAKIPEINSITYSSLPEEDRKAHQLRRSSEASKLLKKLKEKHQIKKE